MKTKNLTLDELDILCEKTRVNIEFLEMKKAIREDLLKQIKEHLSNTGFDFYQEEAVIIATEIIEFVSGGGSEARQLLKVCAKNVKLLY